MGGRLGRLVGGGAHGVWLGRTRSLPAVPMPSVRHSRPTEGSARRRGAAQGADRAPELGGGAGCCPFSTSRHGAMRAPVAACHTRQCRSPTVLVEDRRPGEGGLVLVPEAQDQGSEHHPQLHQRGVQSPASPPDRCAGPLCVRPPRPPCTCARALPLLRPSLLPFPGVLRGWGEGGGSKSRPA